MGFQSDKSWEKVPSHPPFVYFPSFAQYLDPYRIIIMSFDPIDT